MACGRPGCLGDVEEEPPGGWVRSRCGAWACSADLELREVGLGLEDRWAEGDEAAEGMPRRTAVRDGRRPG